MIYNQFYNNMTFHEGFNPSVPPPPLQAMSDEEIVRVVEGKVVPHRKYRAAAPPLWRVRCHIARVLEQLESLKEESSVLQSKVDHVSDAEWSEAMKEVACRQRQLERDMAVMKDSYIELVERKLRRRAGRRRRAARVRGERRALRREERKRLEADVRTEDTRHCGPAEIKPDINALEEERGAGSARRWADRLRALRTLTRARHTRTQSPANSNTALHLDRLISLWESKVRGYEERGRARRGAEAGQEWTWGAALFGAEVPQREFAHRDHLISNRRIWDRYLHHDGDSLPLGWVPPGTNWTCVLPTP